MLKNMENHWSNLKYAWLFRLSYDTMHDNFTLATNALQGTVVLYWVSSLIKVQLIGSTFKEQ